MIGKPWKRAGFALQKLVERKNSLLKHFIGEEAQKKITDHPADFLAQASLVGIQEVSLALRDKQLLVLRSIDAAIGRILNGSYGKCSECDEAIEHQRIEAFPEVALCLRCQEVEEAAEREFCDYAPIFPADD